MQNENLKKTVIQSKRYPFIAEHRGGPLSKDNHRKLIKWAIARSIGQTVATAHMADHSLGGAFYALKAIKLAKKDIEIERNWQTKILCQLPSELMEIVQSMWKKKELDKRI